MIDDRCSLRFCLGRIPSYGCTVLLSRSKLRGGQLCQLMEQLCGMIDRCLARDFSSDAMVSSSACRCPFVRLPGWGTPVSTIRFCLLLTLLSTTCVSRSSAQPLVAENDPFTPEEQRKMFHLPEGFEIQLVASEPLIGQPMNLNFDASGRLWATSTVEYPYPAAGNMYSLVNRDSAYSRTIRHAIG